MQYLHGTMRSIPPRVITLHLLLSCISCCFINPATPGDDPSIPAIAKYFGTKGRYEEVNPHLIEDILAINKSTTQLPPAECRGVHLTAIIRHGTRYPTAKNARKMRQLYELVLRQAGGEAAWLRDIQSRWDMWYNEDMDGRLAQKGVSDLAHLAARLSKRFPALVSEEKLRGGRVSFITSSKHRCVNSTVAFRAGLAGQWGMQGDEFNHEVNDALMRFFDQCARFVDDVVNNPSAMAEVDKFKVGPEMKRVQEKIADRLGVQYNLITHDMAEAAFYLCAYEFAIKTVNSPWCRLFDEADAQVMEYANDLKQFWKRGYGHDINSKSSCILFHDVFSRLDQAASETKSGRQVTEAVTIQVGHADTLLPLLTLLGLFKDTDPLTSANYASQAQRSFRTSHILPYAANLLLVLYDCGEGGMRLRTMLNEKPLAFPGLADRQASIPLYQDVKERYKDLLQGCDFEAECRLLAKA